MNDLKVSQLLANVKEEKLSNGFRIVYYENKEFENYHVEYCTKFGGLDFEYLKDTKKICHSKGIAHFLEHVMFNMPYGEALVKFDKYLGNANAYTAFNKTSYLVDFTTNVLENIETLLDMVNTLHIDVQKVEKEKGIIIEEVEMYDKMPEWNIFSKTMENNFDKIKYKYDILGKKEDVQAMTYEMLKEAYEDFYKPSNQYIVITGPHIKEAVKFIREYMTPKSNSKSKISKIVYKEPELKQDLKSFEVFKDVAQNHISLGHKYFTHKTTYKNDLYIGLALELIYSNFNENYINAIEKGIIDYTFEYDYLVVSNVVLIMFFGVDIDVKSLNEFIKQNNIHSKELQIKEQWIIKDKIGRLIRSLDTSKQIGRSLVGIYYHDITIQNYYEYLTNFKIEEVRGYLNSLNKNDYLNEIKNNK